MPNQESQTKESKVIIFQEHNYSLQKQNYSKISESCDTCFHATENIEAWKKRLVTKGMD